MKFISEKKLSNEPADLKAYRESTEGAKYNGGDFSGATLREVLLEEQGYLCAYCMGKLTASKHAHVEHYYPQRAYPEKGLDYMNLLAVCDGLTYSHPEKEAFHHCDKTKGRDGKMNGDVTLEKLDPLSPSCEGLVSYDLTGSILASGEDETVTRELETVLNLNNEPLRKRRKAVMDRAVEMIKREQPHGRWGQRLLHRHQTQWLSKHDRKGRAAYRAYCMAAVWLIDQLLSKPKYQ